MIVCELVRKKRWRLSDAGADFIDFWRRPEAGEGLI